MFCSVILAATVALVKSAQVGDVTVACDNAKGWSFSASCAAENGAEVVTVDLSSPVETQPPKFDVDFKFSGADVHHVWTTDYTRRDMTIWPSLWGEGKKYNSQLAQNVPLLAAVNAKIRDKMTEKERFSLAHSKNEDNFPILGLSD